MPFQTFIDPKKGLGLFFNASASSTTSNTIASVSAPTNKVGYAIVDYENPASITSIVNTINQAYADNIKHPIAIPPNSGKLGLYFDEDALELFEGKDDYPLAASALVDINEKFTEIDIEALKKKIEGLIDQLKEIYQHTEENVNPNDLPEVPGVVEATVTNNYYMFAGFYPVRTIDPVNPTNEDGSYNYTVYNPLTAPTPSDALQVTRPRLHVEGCLNVRDAISFGKYDNKLFPNTPFTPDAFIMNKTDRLSIERVNTNLQGQKTLVGMLDISKADGSMICYGNMRANAYTNLPVASSSKSGIVTTSVQYPPPISPTVTNESLVPCMNVIQQLYKDIQSKTVIPTTVGSVSIYTSYPPTSTDNTAVTSAYLTSQVYDYAKSVKNLIPPSYWTQTRVPTTGTPITAEYVSDTYDRIRINNPQYNDVVEIKNVRCIPNPAQTYTTVNSSYSADQYPSARGGGLRSTAMTNTYNPLTNSLIVQGNSVFDGACLMKGRLTLNRSGAGILFTNLNYASSRSTPLDVLGSLSDASLYADCLLSHTTVGVTRLTPTDPLYIVLPQIENFCIANKGKLYWTSKPHSETEAIQNLKVIIDSDGYIDWNVIKNKPEFEDNSGTGIAGTVLGVVGLALGIGSLAKGSNPLASIAAFFKSLVSKSNEGNNTTQAQIDYDQLAARIDYDQLAQHLRESQLGAVAARLSASQLQAVARGLSEDQLRSMAPALQSAQLTTIAGGLSGTQLANIGASLTNDQLQTIGRGLYGEQLNSVGRGLTDDQLNGVGVGLTAEQLLNVANGITNPQLRTMTANLGNDQLDTIRRALDNDQLSHIASTLTPEQLAQIAQAIPVPQRPAVDENVPVNGNTLRSTGNGNPLMPLNDLNKKSPYNISGTLATARDRVVGGASDVAVTARDTAVGALKRVFRAPGTFIDALANNARDAAQGFGELGIVIDNPAYMELPGGP